MSLSRLNCNKYRIAKLCSVLEECLGASYYAWDKRPESDRSKANKILLEKIKDIHNESKKVYGSIKIRKKLNDGKNPPINHKRIERLMSERMTKGLVINALNDAYNRAGRTIGVILDSD
ncbi:hypothetical protein DE167_004969 [Clostridium beijerinckii]|uniref:HTH-like domain-containing protein n=1 Tax=Clostridium beijerinckii TaxID=1520 RepID=A0AAX0B157_CLOBE|nr:hypothetical protein [Clostridium beijerinckii]NYC74403.1 hypothetical protein [Clostridium beijerinckii]